MTEVLSLSSGRRGLSMQVSLPRADVSSSRTAAPPRPCWHPASKLWQPTTDLKPPALTVVFTGTTWGSPQSHVGPHCARKADGPGRKASERQTGPSSLCPLVLSRALPSLGYPPTWVHAPGVAGHFHSLRQLQQGNVISVELRDALALLCVDIKPRGN